VYHTNHGGVGARDGRIVGVTAVVCTLTPQAVTTVDQRRFVAV